MKLVEVAVKARNNVEAQILVEVTFIDVKLVEVTVGARSNEDAHILVVVIFVAVRLVKESEVAKRLVVVALINNAFVEDTVPITRNRFVDVVNVKLVLEVIRLFSSPNATLVLVNEGEPPLF